MPWDYVAPDYAFIRHTLAPKSRDDRYALSTAQSSFGDTGSASEAAAVDCPRAEFDQYWRLREQALPLGPVQELDVRCRAALRMWLGRDAYERWETQQPRLQAASKLECAAHSAIVVKMHEFVCSCHSGACMV